MKKIIFTGGGTTGHVTKNKILIEALRQSHPEIEIHYLGMKTGKEAELITPDLATFHPISGGKLRRYAAWETLPDFFRVMKGVGQSLRLLATIKPQLVFSSGGYVALPVAIAAWMRKIPVITHETDSTPGLANRMIGRMASKVLLGYESAAEYFDPARTIFVGNPVAPSLFEGSKARALEKLGFSADKKTLLVMGGSQGATQINELIVELLPRLREDGWQVVHLTGKGKNGGAASSDYRPFEYVGGEYADYLAVADLVISRAGGNSLAELSMLGKAAILIPLPLPAAAGDHQRKNALEMLKKYPEWKMMLNPTPEELLKVIAQMKISPPRPEPDLAAKRALDVIASYLA